MGSPSPSCPRCAKALPRAAQTCPACGLPQRVLGEYRLERSIGKGGTAEVFAARREADGARVAVKLMVLAGQGDWKPRELFERSTKVLRQLDHPQLPTVHAFGELDDGALVLVTERMEGGSLQSRVEQEQWHASPEAVRSLLRSLLELLEYLHGRVPPVIHRDIKPSNVMFRGPADAASRGPPVLVDFDSVAAPRRRGEGGHTVIVSPGYTAPEQLAGVDGPAADLFSVGMTVLYAVSHREPETFERDDDGELVLGAVGEGLDAGCRRVLRALTRVSARDRPASATAALAMLRAPVRAEPRAATRDRASARVATDSEPQRRGPWLLGAGVAAAAVAIGVGVAWLDDADEPVTPASPPTAAVEPAEPAVAPAPWPPPAPAPARPLYCRDRDRGDCDGQRDNGCETDILWTAAHCGACDHACPPSQVCREGRCAEPVEAVSFDGRGGCELRRGGAVWCGEREDALQEVPLPRPAVQVQADAHRCAVTDDHRLLCWGANRLGQAGTGSGRVIEPTPVHLDSLPEVTQVALGRKSACAVSAGQAYCWGSALSFAVLGSTRVYGSDTPVKVRRMDEIRSMVSGPMHVCVIRTGGVWCWGDGRGGATGDPERPQGSNPTHVEGLEDATALALGRDHSCALRPAGEVACWGTNAAGQLGDGTRDDHVTPSPVVDLPPAVQIVATGSLSCALAEDGVPWCWGGKQAWLRPQRMTLPAPARALAMQLGRPMGILADGNVALATASP